MTVSQNNSSTYGAKQINNSQLRKVQGSKKRGQIIGSDEISINHQVNQSVLINDSQVYSYKPKVSSQVAIRKGISKSTLRSNLKNLQNNKQLNSNNNMRV